MQEERGVHFLPYFDAIRSTYHPEPHITRPLFELSHEFGDRMLQRLPALYPDPAARSAMAEIERILKVFYAHKALNFIEREQNFNPTDRFTEPDVILINYGDLLYRRHQSHLKTLGDFCDTYLRGTINTIHILSFFPFFIGPGFFDHGF
jgi:glucosylglycerate phosphorylase